MMIIQVSLYLQLQLQMLKELNTSRFERRET
jgi:hypothetical protein